MAVPDSFDAIPILNNQSSWFFAYAKTRREEDIDILWNMFEVALQFADGEGDEWQSEFLEAFQKARAVNRVRWNLTMGLFWIRPWFYLPLDRNSRQYIRSKLTLPIDKNGPYADEYLKLRENLEARFNEENYPIHSFPDLSYAAWQYQGNDEETDLQDEDENEAEAAPLPPPIQSYSIDNILGDGCFIPRENLKNYLGRLRMKKNLILQGPPGTGKTWLAKRLGFALMGQKSDRRVRSLQFHPNLSYEDFVRGWRPSGEGRLALANGPLMEMIEEAKKAPDTKFVMIIEEINRGNPAQIFGEMLTLLEADKRTPEAALELSYRMQPNEKVFIPENLYLIGTMNIADRSLALVDLALRRRFAFVDLEPQLNDVWKDWVCRQNNLPDDVVTQIQQRLLRLNEEIEADPTLGRQFRIGHSYVTPPLKESIPNPWHWFKQVVLTEIGPLLDEYWFDNLPKSRDAKDRLLDGL